MCAAGAEPASGPVVDVPARSADHRLVWVWWLALVTIALSRALAVFDGPWEADEALFSLGVLDFHVPGHRPHPPGFPGFVFTGRALAWAVSDPLLALRLVSIAGSLVGVVAMQRLLRTIVRAEIAMVTTLAFAFVPGVWAHSARAFTTTPALAAVLGAGLVVLARRERGELEPGPWPWLLVGYALTMRPQFVIPVTVIVVAAGVAVLARRGPGALARPLAWASVAALVVIGVYAAVALDSGGVDAYVGALRSHAGQHGRAIHSSAGLPAFEQLGLVRVVGGVPGFVALTLVTAPGAWLAFRRSASLGLGSLALVCATTAAMLYAHHPAFPRYSVIWVAALVPWAALTLDALADWRGLWPGVVVGVAATVAGAAAGWPAIAYMRSNPLPAVAAIDAAVDAGARALQHSPGPSPFVRLVAEVPRAPGLAAGELGHAVPDRSHQPAIGAALLQVDSFVLDGATVIRDAFEIASPAARGLGQDRYDRAVLVRQGVVLGQDMYRVERSPGGERFVWLGSRARLLPPRSLATGADERGRRLMLDVLVVGDRAPQRVQAWCGSQPVGEWTLDAGPARLSIALGECPEGVELTLPDARADNPDRRPLALRLVRAWVEGPGVAVADARWSVGDRERVAALGVELDGFHNPETFGQRRGRWVAGEASISFPAEPGLVEIVVARPGFLAGEGEVVIETDVDRYAGEISDQPTAIRLRTDAPGGRTSISIRGPSFQPSSRRATSRDDRALAAIVYEVARSGG